MKKQKICLKKKKKNETFFFIIIYLIFLFIGDYSKDIHHVSRLYSRPKN